jgi:SAM-dependent methyltransferase
MSPAGPVDADAVRAAVRAQYSAVATGPRESLRFRTGRAQAEWLGYPSGDLDGVPGVALDPFAGVAYPFEAGRPNPRATVLDLGCGAGLDALIAARSAARVIGIDMTLEMVERAKRAAAQLRLAKVEFRHAVIESLPLEDASVDLVISNGVINLCPDKEAVYAEIARVLRPGGRVQIADLVVDVPPSADQQANVDLWTG